jgi:hypothetical protein
MFTRRILALAAALFTAFTVASTAASAATVATPSSAIVASGPAHNPALTGGCGLCTGWR